MPNWYSQVVKKAWNTGIPLMDQYSEGWRPRSSDHKKEKDPVNDRTHAKPEFGGNKRKGYPRNTQSVEDHSDYEEQRGQIPGENVLMDQDPPTGEGVNHGEFDSVGEGPFGGGSDNDKVHESNLSKQIDRGVGPAGPHNMWTRGVFRKMKNKTRGKGLNLL